MKVQVRELYYFQLRILLLLVYLRSYYSTSKLIGRYLRNSVRTKHMNPSFNNVLRKHNVDIADNVLKCFSYEGLGVHGALTSESCRVIFVINCFRRYALILNTQRCLKFRRIIALFTAARQYARKIETTSFTVASRLGRPLIISETNHHVCHCGAIWSVMTRLLEPFPANDTSAIRLVRVNVVISQKEPTLFAPESPQERA